MVDLQMALAALKRLPAEQMASDALKEAILSGVMAPGERLTEVDLAEQFGVSRGTVRIALHRLSSEGLVVLTPYTGWAVVDFEPRDLWEIYTLRAGLESVAARLATEKLDAQGAARLETVAKELFKSAESGDIVETKRKDFALHRCIVELSQNSRLENHYRMVEQQVRMFISSTYTPDKYSSVVVEHHQPIVEAILRRKPRLAARLCDHHCTSEGERILLLRPEAESKP
jgi:DNA-binding GntR family transcriptional regulator